MLITIACPSCAVPLTIASHTKGKRISCINCGHQFIVDAVADPAPVVPLVDSSPQSDWQAQPPPIVSQVDSSSQSDWQAQPPPVRGQPPPDQLEVLASDEECARESGGNEFGDLGNSVSEPSEENMVRYRSHDRTRITLAVLGGLFSILSVACLSAGLFTHLPPWFYGSAASSYAGAHMSLFAKGPIRIIGILLNIAVMVGCIVSVILLKGLIRIEHRW